MFLSEHKNTHHKLLAGLRDEFVTALMDQQFAVDTVVALPQTPYRFSTVATVGCLEENTRCCCCHYSLKKLYHLHAIVTYESNYKKDKTHSKKVTTKCLHKCSISDQNREFEFILLFFSLCFIIFV